MYDLENTVIKLRPVAPSREGALPSAREEHQRSAPAIGTGPTVIPIVKREPADDFPPTGEAA